MKRKDGESRFFASCPQGLEELLHNEMIENRITETFIRRGGIEFITLPINALKLLLTSRIASRIFREVAFFNIQNEQDLYDKAMKEDWTKIFALEQTFKINTLLDNRANLAFKNSMFLSQKLKDAMCDVFRREVGKRPDVDTKRANCSFLTRIEGQGKKNAPWRCTVLIDMCGKPLSNRGYRLERHEAPLRENVAAAIVMNMDWNKAEDMFIDSMCGSGTLLIEAALIKGNIPPTYLKLERLLEDKDKIWSFLHHKWFNRDSKLVQKFYDIAEDYLEQAANGLNDLPEGQFEGYDIANKSINVALDSLENAYLSDVISIERADATKLERKSEHTGVIVCNAPYGERLGQFEQLETLYYEYGENLKANFKGYKAYILTSDTALRKKISLQTSKRIPIQNGNLECRLLQYNLF